MAARIDAAAQGSPFQCFFSVIFCFLFMAICLDNILPGANNIYSWHNLLRIEMLSERAITAEFLCSHDIPTDIARSPDSPWIIIPAGRRGRRHRQRKQKRGCKAGALARLRKQPHKPLLPSIFLTNARSLDNKMDELRLLVATYNIERRTATFCSSQKPGSIHPFRTWLSS